jgi:ribosomal protein S12 methylthiotransferase accessory factor
VHGLPNDLKAISYFGSTTNGLCSGNSVREAIVHGVLEVIERDIESFNIIRDRSQLVRFDEYSPTIENLIRGIEEAGFEIFVRSTLNEYKLAYFSAYIIEKNVHAPIYVCSGHGCHFYKHIALVRAIVEAAQSRLSFIHGGRDDLLERYNMFGSFHKEKELEYVRKLKENVRRNDSIILYSAIDDLTTPVSQIDQALDILNERLNSLGFKQIFAIPFTMVDEPLQVLKVIIPKTESFNNDLRRVGPRLVEYVGAYV